jgi:hypothetical protein
LPFGLGGGRPDAYGFSQNIFGLVRWQSDGFSVVSFDRAILEQCASWLNPVPSQDFAQARLYLGDIKHSKVSSFFNVLSFRRAAQATRGNLMLLDSISQQLHVPTQDALRVAEELLDAKLQCTLGGEYQLDQADREHSIWQSTAWSKAVGSQRARTLGFNPDEALPAPYYAAPWLQWFRGANLHLTQLPERLILVGTIEMERSPAEPTKAAPKKPDSKPEPSTAKEQKEDLPKLNLDLFNIPFQFFQGDKPKENPKDPASPKPKTDRRDF